MIFQAIDIAAKAHRGAYRKITRIPYLSHPLRVAQIVIEYGFDEEPLAVAAILHDTLEDSDMTLDELRHHFGREVADLVDWVTVHDQAAGWRQRKHAFLERMEHAPFTALVLACADKLDNVRSLRKDVSRLGELVWQALTTPKDEQRWYYTSVAEVLIRRLANTKGVMLSQELQIEVNQVFGQETQA